MKSCFRGGLGRRMSAIVLSVVLPAALCRGETAEWLEPDLDTWSYPNAVYQPGIPFATPGSRLFAPSFGGFSLDEQTNQLNPGFASRTGYTVFAFDTTEEVESGLSRERYVINSVTATLKARKGQEGPIVYSATPLTIESALDDVINDEFGVQVPVELFGVGFNGGYDGFGLGDASTSQPYTEAEPVWSNGEYLLYPTDAEGRDSVNSLNGGNSSTEPSGETDPFTHTPFAIGTVPGAIEGAQLPDDTTFEFDLDLTNAGVLDYVKRGLSDGVLGFTVSTLHFATMTETGNGGFYPQWYTKDAVASGFYPNAAPASLTVDFEILPLPGDYDNSGFVDVLDYNLWRSEFGNSGIGADGNQDGVVNLADYTIWRDNLGSGTPPLGALNGSPIAVPEPSVFQLLGVLGVTAVFCGWVEWFIRPRKSQRK